MRWRSTTTASVRPAGVRPRPCSAQWSARSSGRRRALAAGLKVAALVLALAAIGAVAHGHTEHGKILHGRAGEVRVP